MTGWVTDSTIAGRRPGALLGRVDPATVGPSIALIAMFAVFSILSPYFLTRNNLTNVLMQSAPLLILVASVRQFERIC